MTPSSSSFKPPKPSALERVRALTSKLSASTSNLRSESDTLIEADSPTTEDSGVSELLAKDSTKSKSLGRLNVESSILLTSPPDSYDNVGLNDRISIENRDTYARKGIKFDEILAPKANTVNRPVQSSQSSIDVREQVSPELSCSRTRYSSTSDLRSLTSSGMNMIRNRPTPLPRSSLNPITSYVRGSTRGLCSTERPGSSDPSSSSSVDLGAGILLSHAHQTRALGRVELISGPGLTSTHDYPADKDPFFSPPTTPQPIAAQPTPRKDAQSKPLSSCDANLSSRSSRAFDRGPLNSLANLYPNKSQPYSSTEQKPKSTLSYGSNRANSLFNELDKAKPPSIAETRADSGSRLADSQTNQPLVGAPALRSEAGKVSTGKLQLDGIRLSSHATSSAGSSDSEGRQILPSGSTWTSHGTRPLGQTDLYTAAEKRLFARTKSKADAPPPPIRKPPEDPSTRPSSRRALSDLQYSTISQQVKHILIFGSISPTWNLYPLLL